MLMKKLFLICALLASTTLVFAKSYQYFIACGKVYATDARVPASVIVALIDYMEDNC
ncbi:hypothetical protein IX307_001791 [Bacteroides pyogenes]|nr:hypothetical protein [Bacteroides pyogenes]MBR8708195.1 hypothetical protein [Bacteroides pyogenes]MBR8716779.1 hypothetical protein [Bacteroides pyogenes]MBR8720620.1 hypothetical protein [Bacteroides pyogenes]MBR8725567.1 hypothetical protein [Bacteroides pyogenes]